jgi:curved DNA-binding protein CbpA
VGADAAIAAGLEHSGSLAKDGPLRLFAIAAAVQATGRLTISTDVRDSTLSFRRGTVEHAASSDPEDGVGPFLVRKGAITPAGLGQAEAARPRSGGDLAAALIAERLVSPADVAGLLQEHGVGIVQRALAAEEGSWAWAPAAAPPPGAFPLAPPFAVLCGAVRALDAPGVARRLGDREHRAAARVAGRLQLEDLRLTPQEARAAGLFDGSRSAAELAAGSPGDAVVILRVALLLGEADLLSFGALRKGVPPPASAKPSAPPAAQAPAPPRPAAPRPPPAARPGPQPARPAATPAPAARPAPPAALDAGALRALLAKLAKADHFEVLGVARAAPGPDIKVAYFQLAKTYHPDAVPASTAPEVKKLCSEVFSKVSEAWSVLAEDAPRAAYLEALATGSVEPVDVANIFQAENVFQEGALLAKARRYDEAIRKFEEATKLNPEEAEFAIWKAYAEFLAAPDKRTRFSSGASAIEAALKRNPRCAQGYLFLGQMAKLMGDLGLAERHLKRGLEVAPEHGDLQRELRYLRK